MSKAPGDRARNAIAWQRGAVAIGHSNAYEALATQSRTVRGCCGCQLTLDARSDSYSGLSLLWG